MLVYLQHRTYLYYTSSTEPRQYWCYPRVDVVDGTEPSLEDLLSGADLMRDLSGSGNDGLITNGYTYENNTISFDGDKQYIKCNNSNGLNNSTGSAQVWIYPKNNNKKGKNPWRKE